MTPTSVRHLVLLCVCILLAGGMDAIAGSESGVITGVTVSPDGKRILVKTDGMVGQHSAFVLRNPCRLVVDFDRLGMGKIPAKYRGLADGMEEVRLGYINGRTRLVVDFGDRPAPAFTVLRVNQGVQITLGGAPNAAKTTQRPQRAQEAPKSVVPEPRGRIAVTPKSSGPALLVKSATLKNDAVLIELADSEDPKRTYRLSVDLDAVDMLVKSTTITDHTGNRQRFEPLAGDTPKATGTDATAGPRGPRKEPEAEAAPVAPPGKYKWGSPTVETKRPAVPQAGAALRSPLRP
jgi:hypothetical protein